MTLYDRIKEQENHIEGLRKSILFAVANGFEVKGEYPKLGEHAEALVGDVRYRGNPIIHDMRDGKKLSTIVDDLFSRWSFWDRYRLSKVREFNKRNEPLKEIVPWADRAERDYALSINAPEGCGLFFGGALASAAGIFLYNWGYQEMREVFPAVIAGFGSIGGLVGIYGGLCSSISLKRVRKNMDGVIKYIDNLLERK